LRKLLVREAATDNLDRFQISKPPCDVCQECPQVLFVFVLGALAAHATTP
jgi:hypothetical protein